jgi:hypothetical protein
MFDNITVIRSPLVLSTPAEVDAAEAHLGIRFPTGYREYVTKFGEGVLGGVVHSHLPTSPHSWSDQQ